MKIETRVAIVLFMWLAGLTAFAQSQEPMPLARRVQESQLIVVGKLQGAVTISKHQDSSTVQIEKVLFGSFPTNRVLLVWYATDRQLTPGIASSTHQISPTNRYICFLTFDHSKQTKSDTVQARAIGKGHYAYNAFALATDAALKEVATLIAERNKKK
jgi:hypothetical protein